VPKGIVHSTGGYLTYIKYTCKKFFGYKANSVVFTASDAGWINGHTYAVYGPLMYGATSILIENPMKLTDEKILGKIIKELNVTILYLPVTLIRILKSLNIKKINQNKILTIGSMGEPLAPEISKWYINFFNPKNKLVVNTYFQTETGGILVAPTYNENKKYFDHGSVGKIKNFAGLKINNNNDEYIDNELSITNPWPGCMKNVLNGKKVWNKYFDKKNNFRLFDTGALNKNLNLFIHGRTDDVINIRGHRIGSAEVESLLLEIDSVVESCAVGVEDELEGYVFVLFVVLKNRVIKIDNLVKKILKDNFGSYAFPQKIFILNELPKTKSGKILRRLLRDIYNNENYKKNDFSTINKSGLIEELSNTIKLQNENNF
jgi:acetyl-CoA synthetase